ncbi:hypothetical protein FOA52_013449 [Chlamydomonas sp. UWO 241]|nr:hypothetical protein FOA52_013449 [Chlamydomonas sp. UWO 241]UBZ25204.1 dehydroascorbate reductase [Chlamydomonas sp. UWO 241]
MAANAPMTIVVKGDPTNGGKLGDCPFCHRALLTLSTKGLKFDIEYVDFAAKPDWVVALGGKVPILKVLSEDIIMPDSDKIVVYLEDKYPSPSMKSEGGIPEWMGKIFPAFRAFVNGPTDATFDAMIDTLKASEEALAKVKGPLFGGTALNEIDAAFAPRLYHIMVMSFNKGFGFPPDLGFLWRYMGYIQTLDAWQQVDYGTKKIVEGWSKPH